MGLARELVSPGLGFPRIKPTPEKCDVDAWKGMLKELTKDGKLDNLRRATDRVEKHMLEQFGGRRPMDWYGPSEVLSAVVNEYGTAGQKKAWSGEKKQKP
jgi:hypothetical protein